MRPNRLYERLRTTREQGQVLIMFSLLIIVLMLCVMAVVDVGFLLKERQDVQKAADAAALAGAQELPDDPAAAEAVALEYLAANGIEPDEVDISFECTSDTSMICLDGDGRYDTIVVDPKSQAPAFFGPILAVIGVDTCWIQGCHVQAEAAGCRGACGPIGTGPADIMLVLDHSYSMSTTDLANAKNATREMLEDFDHTYQNVGLAVTPPVNPAPGDTCDAINSWYDDKEWKPAGLSANFQTNPHVLNTTSGAYYQANCLDRTSWSSPGELTNYPICSCHTDVGSPIQAATQELAANGRPDVTWGMIVLTDGAANVAPFTSTTTQTSTPGATSWRTCGSHGAVTSGAGDNNGFQSNGSAACSNGGSYAADDNSGTNTTVDCANSGKDRHRYWNFNLSSEIPSGSTIDGIEIRLDAWAAGSGTRDMCVELSWNGGSSWTAPKTISSLATGETTYYLGSATDTWGRSWSTSELSGSNFRIRITNVSSVLTNDFRLDYLAARVSYTTTTTSTTYDFDGSLGPCDWAMQQANAAKALGIEIYVIGYGLNATERCRDFQEKSESPYYNYTAAQILEAMATSEDHFFNEPDAADLEPVFQSIGQQLTGGSRLVR